MDDENDSSFNENWRHHDSKIDDDDVDDKIMNRTSPLQLSNNKNSNIYNNNNQIKAKNPPNFTIILRRKLPIINSSVYINDSLNLNSEISNDNINLYQKQNFNQSNAGLIQSQNEQQTIDFKFDDSWQIWLQIDESNIDDGNDCKDTSGGIATWNIKRFGTPSRTAQQFWCTYQQLNEEIKGKDFYKNIMIFRDSIEPKWEDKCNIGGGRWYFDLSHSNNSMYQQRLLSTSQMQNDDFLIKSNCWTQCIQIVTSGCLGLLNHIVVGMILHFKSNKYRVSFWVRTQTNFNQVIELGKKLQKHLNLRCQIKFELHTGNIMAHSNSNDGCNGSDVPQVFNGLKIDCSQMEMINRVYQHQ